MRYGPTLGLTAIRTGDNSRRLMAITETEVPFNGPVSNCRDAYFRITIDPTHGPQTYVLMPYNASPEREAAFHISAWAPVPVALAPIESDRNVAVEGAWTAESAGGSTTFSTWRNNPQFLLCPSEATTVTVILRQRNDIASTTEHIGFHVLSASDGVRRALSCDPAAVVATAAHNNAHSVVATVRVQGMRERLGRPYLIVPSTLRPGAETGFTLEVVSNRRMQLKTFDPEGDYRRVVWHGKLDYAKGTAGGALAYSSWRHNPQHVLTFPVRRTGTLLVSMGVREKKLPPGEEQRPNEIGLVLMKADEWDRGRRRKVTVSNDDVVARSPVTTDAATELSYDFTDQRAPLLLMPFTTLPHVEVEYTITVYSTCNVEVEDVQEWYSADVAGEWVPGITAGGHRGHALRGWLNNPFFSLSLTKPTRVVLVALQYPKGPEKPMVRRVGKHRVIIPPPIVNERSKVCFGFDVVASDEANTPIHGTKHSFEGEVVAVLQLPPCETTPYFVVPHTFEPELGAEFRVIAYADAPITFTPHEKERRFW